MTALFTARNPNSGPERQNHRGFPNQHPAPKPRDKQEPNAKTPRSNLHLTSLGFLSVILGLSTLYLVRIVDSQPRCKLTIPSAASTNFWSELPIAKLHSVANTAAFTSPSSHRHVTPASRISFFSSPFCPPPAITWVANTIGKPHRTNAGHFSLLTARTAIHNALKVPCSRPRGDRLRGW